MFDYQSLLNVQNGVYQKVPARSRKQDFVMYKITNDPVENLNEVAKTFNYQYLAVQKSGVTALLIPFETAIKSDQLEDIDFDFLNQDFERYAYGHSYRDRSATPTPFTLYNGTATQVNALKFTEDQNLYFDQDKIKEALEAYVQTSDFKTIIADQLELRNFLHTIANDVYKQIYDQGMLDMILSVLKPFIPNLSREYKTAYQEVSISSELRAKTKPFGQYLKLYQTNRGQSKNISQQMLSMMASDFEPNPKLDLSLAADLIAQVYPPALLESNGRDRDNVVIFNPLSGAWVHDADIFLSLLVALRPYSDDRAATTMVATFAAQARNKNNFIKAYEQSRYLIFKNTVLDVKTMLTHNLDEDEVKELHFTERHLIGINYDPEVIDAPEFPGRRRSDGGTWDPYTFLMAYANNDIEKFKYLMFGLSLGLFAGHNFGVHFDIKGESRWGKTTLSEIYKALFQGQVFEILFSKLNEQFGFTSFKDNTSIVWIRECNTEAAPLNNDYGVPVYDSFADNQTSIQVKSKGDLQIQNPPQVYIDGTSYVKAKDMDTGPAGRTFVYKLPMDDDADVDMTALVNQAYANDIVGLLHDESVLQFLVNLMINAYRETLSLDDDNRDRLWSLKLNFGGKSSDTQLLPSFAQSWRKEMTQTQGGDIQEWFEYDFSPYFSTDPDNPTIMHAQLAYLFYATDYQSKYSRQDPHNQFLLGSHSFEHQFNNLLKEAGWEKSDIYEPSGRKARKSIKYLSKTNFDEQAYKDDGHQIPMEFTTENINSDHPEPTYPLGRKTTGWYMIKQTEQP